MRGGVGSGEGGGRHWTDSTVFCAMYAVAPSSHRQFRPLQGTARGKEDAPTIELVKGDRMSLTSAGSCHSVGTSEPECLREIGEDMAAQQLVRRGR